MWGGSVSRDWCTECVGGTVEAKRNTPPGASAQFSDSPRLLPQAFLRNRVGRSVHKIYHLESEFSVSAQNISYA
jgi:hypothetical protein